MLRSAASVEQVAYVGGVLGFRSHDYALGLVDINRKTDTGTYIEEGLWVQHL